MYDHLGPIRVLTSECRNFAKRSSVYEWCCDLSVSDAPTTPPCQLSSELPSSLRLECCFVIGSTPGVAPPPRVGIFLFRPVSLDTNCSFTPHYTRVDTVHHDPPVPPPEVTSKSYAASVDKEMRFARCHHVRNPNVRNPNHSKDDLPQAKVPTEGTETRRTKMRRGADACLSLARETFARVALKWCVMSRVGARGTSCVQLVEQESVRLGTDTKHSEVQNLFS